MATYSIQCLCSMSLTGDRLARHQVLTCPSCRRHHYVAPNSPFLVPEKPRKFSDGPRGVVLTWRGPLLAVVLGVGVVTSGLLVAWPYLVRPEPAHPEGGSPVTFEEATQALANGQYNLARAQFKTLLEARTPTDQSTSELHHLLRQADLLARLAPRSLEEIVRHAALVRHPEEWASQFDDYRQRTIILDDALRRDDRGRPMLTHYVLADGDTSVRLALEELTLLRDLPLDDAPRVIFGARLAACTREEGGTWVIHLVPNSGVLLTEPAALESCYLQPLDESTRAVLERQKRWRALEPR